VDKAFIAECEHKSGNDDRKRKFEPKKDNREPYAQKLRSWQSVPSENKPVWNNGGSNNKVGNQSKTFGKQLVIEDCRRNNTCFTCGQSGHYAKQCPTNNGKQSGNHKPQVNHIGRCPTTTSNMDASTTSLPKKSVKLQTSSLVCFLSITYLP
jgi:hypothetical protein